MSTARSVVHGALGFAAVSLAAFSVWAFVDPGSDAVLYPSVAAVFLGLSGLFLSPLAGGAGPFYKTFVPAFLAYAVVWSGIWFASRSRLGEWLASAAATMAFAFAACLIRRARGWLVVAGVLFLTHSVGYFLGGDFYYAIKPRSGTLARLSWGLFYGLGFGAGLGYAFSTFRKTAAP